MRWTAKTRRRATAGLACAALSLGWLPVSADPVLPPACDPTVSGIGVPGCPSVLLGEAGDLEHPDVALPDLTPDVTEVYIDYESITLDPDTGQWTFGTPYLNFDTHSQNQGLVPVDLRAENPMAVEGSPATQCVSWTTNLVCRQRQRVGGLTWHDEHKHYHYEGFASYELRRLLPDGRTDFSADGLLSSSPKVSTCLIDSVPARDDASPLSRYNSCTPLEQGISPGWADIYAAGIEGQLLPIAGLPNGRYALVLALNTSKSLFETTFANNQIEATIEIRKINTFFPEAEIIAKKQS